MKAMMMKMVKPMKMMKTIPQEVDGQPGGQACKQRCRCIPDRLKQGLPVHHYVDGKEGDEGDDGDDGSALYKDGDAKAGALGLLVIIMMVALRTADECDTMQQKQTGLSIIVQPQFPQALKMGNGHPSHGGQQPERLGQLCPQRSQPSTTSLYTW